MAGHQRDRARDHEHGSPAPPSDSPNVKPGGVSVPEDIFDLESLSRPRREPSPEVERIGRQSRHGLHLVSRRGTYGASAAVQASVRAWVLGPWRAHLIEVDATAVRVRPKVDSCPADRAL